MKCTVTTFRSTLPCRKLITEDLRCTGTARHKKTENCFLASPVDIKKNTSGSNTSGPHGTCFHVARVVSTPSNRKVSLMLCGNRMCPPGRVSTYSYVQGPANQQTSFSGRDDECVAHKLPFSGHIIKKFSGPSILQLNIQGLTASKMNVLHHLATQLEAFVILLQETHCISAEKLVLSNYQLAGFSLSRKHGLATFVHERLQWTLYDQSPTTSETEWLCVDVDGYKIVLQTSTNAVASFRPSSVHSPLSVCG